MFLSFPQTCCIMIHRISKKRRGERPMSDHENERTAPAPSGEQHVTHRCKGCRNECLLDVTMCGGKVTAVSGGGCRRSMVNAKKYLEQQ